MDDYFSYLGTPAGRICGLGKMGRIVGMLFLLKQGKTRKEIAGIFGVTRRCVYLWEHDAKVMLGIDTTFELVCWACKEGLFELYEKQGMDEMVCEGGLGGREEWA
jgi:hypothetical protein